MAIPPTATGDNDPNFHPTELLFDPRRGMSVRQRVTCGKLTPAAQSALLTMVNEAQAIGASGKMVFSGALPTLEYEFPGIPSNLVGVVEELFFDDWQMSIDDLTNTIFANVLLSANLNYNDRMFFQRYAKLGSGTDADDVVTSLNSDLAAGLFIAPTSGDGGTAGSQFQAPAPSPLADQVFLTIDKDQTEFLDPLPVLSHTSCSSPGSSYNATRNNEMCIYTPAELLSEVGSGWTYNLPGRLYSEIAAFPSQSPSYPEFGWYTWGWLKTRQTQRTQTNFMIEVHQEYKLNLWPNLTYAQR